jgi:hypothetical protein
MYVASLDPTRMVVDWKYKRHFTPAAFAGDAVLAWRFVATLYHELDPDENTMVDRNIEAWNRYYILAGPCDHEARCLPYRGLRNNFLPRRKGF